MKDETLLPDEEKLIEIFICLGIQLKYYLIPQVNGNNAGPGTEFYEKWMKYNRDFLSYRGMVNICARETKEFCSCMNEKKAKAKTLGKIGNCFGCRKVFPKKDLKYCKSCLATQYCGKKCQKKNWLQEHNSHCTRYDFHPCGKCNIFVPAAQLPTHVEGCRCDKDAKTAATAATITTSSGRSPSPSPSPSLKNNNL